MSIESILTRVNRVTFDTLEKILNFNYNHYIANMTIDYSLHPILEKAVYQRCARGVRPNLTCRRKLLSVHIGNLLPTEARFCKFRIWRTKSEGNEINIQLAM